MALGMQLRGLSARQHCLHGTSRADARRAPFAPEWRALLSRQTIRHWMPARSPRPRRADSKSGQSGLDRTSIPGFAKRLSGPCPCGIARQASGSRKAGSTGWVLKVCSMMCVEAASAASTSPRENAVVSSRFGCTCRLPGACTCGAPGSIACERVRHRLQDLRSPPGSCPPPGARGMPCRPLPVPEYRRRNRWFRRWLQRSASRESQARCRAVPEHRWR